MSPNPEPHSLKRLEGRIMACEGILRSQLGRRHSAAGSKALQALRPSQALLSFESHWPGPRARGRPSSLARRASKGKLLASKPVWLALAACLVALAALCVYRLLPGN